VTLDAMGESGLGIDIGAQRDPKHPFGIAFARAQQTIERNFNNPFAPYLPDKQFDEDVELLRKYVNSVIDKRKQEDWQNMNDVLSRFMKLEKFSDTEIRDNLLNFLVAGRDGTATAVAWATLLLSQNPEKEQKLRDEIEKVLGDGEVTAEAIKKMQYVHWVIQESLRIWPSVPYLPRFATVDDVLPNGIKIPAGSVVIYSMYTVGRDEKYWKDPLKFIPERFEHLDQFYDSMQYCPFHAGPQTCLGINMASIEAAVALVMLFQRYTFKLVPGHPIVPVRNIVMKSRDGMLMTVKRVK